MHDRLLRATCARTLAPAFAFLAFVIGGALMATASGSAPARITIESGTPQSAHAWAPPGTNKKIDSGLRSLARCTKAEKSGLATGMRTEPTISPPAALNSALFAAMPSCAAA